MQANVLTALPVQPAQTDKSVKPKAGESQSKTDFTAQLTAEQQALQKAGEGPAHKQEQPPAKTSEEPEVQEELNITVTAPVIMPFTDVVVIDDEVVAENPIEAIGEQSAQDDSVGILERSADTDVPDAQMPPMPSAFEEVIKAQEEPDLQPQTQGVQADAKARMPENVSAKEQLNSSVTIQQTSGSLENVDESQIPPPSRVVVQEEQPATITQLNRQDTQQAPVERPVVETKEQTSPDLTATLMQQPTQIPSGTSTQSDRTPAISPFEQIAMEATLHQGLGKNSFVMKLNPEELGEVTVRLIMQESGVVARISASNESARAAISEQLVQLGESMKEKGIDVRSVELAQEPMGHMAFLHDGRQSQDQQAPPRWKVHHFDTTAVEDAELVSEYENFLSGQIGAETSGVEMDA